MKYLILVAVIFSKAALAYKIGNCAHSDGTTTRIDDIGKTTVTLFLIKTNKQSVEDLYRSFPSNKIPVEKPRFEKYWKIVECQGK